MDWRLKQNKTKNKENLNLPLRAAWLVPPSHHTSGTRLKDPRPSMWAVLQGDCTCKCIPQESKH